MHFSRGVVPGILLAVSLAGCQTTPPEEEPAYLKATAVEARTATVEGRAQAMEARIAVVERQAQALLELQRQQDRQAGELRALRGELEQLQELARKGSEEQRNLYADIDRRLSALEARPVGAAAAGVAVGVGSTVSPGGTAQAAEASGAVTAGTDEEAYQAALAKLRAKDYAGATVALAGFPKRYPESPLRDNAAYWLGEAYYVDGRYAEALAAFQSVVTGFPDSRKRADALLKAGFCQVELRQWAGARKSLRRVVSEFPGTPAAKEAAARLATFDGSKAR